MSAIRPNAHNRYKEKIDDNLYLFRIGHMQHGKPSFYLYVPEEFLTDDWLETPLFEVQFTQVDEKAYLLQKGPYTAFSFVVDGGFRGTSSFNIYTPDNKEDDFILLPYEIWDSPQGTIGINRGGFVLTRTLPVIVEWQRDGRTYGAPKRGVSVIEVDSEGKFKIVDYPGLSYESFIQLKSMTGQTANREVNYKETYNLTNNFTT